MKFTLTFKTPDVMDQLELTKEQKEKAEQFLEKFLIYSECIDVEFDTENQTARVLTL